MACTGEKMPHIENSESAEMNVFRERLKIHSLQKMVRQGEQRNMAEEHALVKTVADRDCRAETNLE